jgi:hypothetical protein
MVIFDTETYRLPNAGAFLDPVVVPPIKPDKRFTDPAKKAQDIADKEAAREIEIREKEQEQLAECSLYPYLSRIVSLAWCWPNDEIVTVRLCKTEHQEREALQEFWAQVVDPSSQAVVPLIGFNSRAFDLPLLMVRSRFLGVRAPILNIDKYRSPHPDVMLALSYNGAIRARSLKWYGRRLGLNVDDAFSGGEIGQLVESGNWAAVAKHNEADVIVCKALAEWCGILRPSTRPLVPAVDVEALA